MKTCSRCRASLALVEFPADTRRADGLGYWCKGCRRAYRADWYQRNRSRQDELSSAWRKGNPEKIAALERRWASANKDKVRAKHRRRYHRRRATVPDLLRAQGVERQQRRRARLAEVPSERVDRLAVFERDEWTCQLCWLPVAREVAWPNPKSPSLDHRIPLAAGGGHTYANTQLAHLFCNQSKGAGLFVGEGA